MIKLLPHWVLTDVNPAFYDVESKTAVEQTAKVYAKMQELIKEYNGFVDEVNKTIVEFTESTTKDNEKFKNCITKLVHDYIIVLDEKIKMQDANIDNAVKYMKDNLSESVNDVVTSMMANGELNDAILQALEGVNTKILSLENEDVELNRLITSNRDSIQELSDKNTSIESGISRNTNNINNIITDIETINQSIETINNNIDGIEGSRIDFMYHEDTKELNLMVNNNEIIIEGSGS